MRTGTTLSVGNGIFGKLIFSAFGLFFAAVGLFFVSMAWKGMVETKAMQQWVETPCAIVSSEMQDAGEDYKLVLSYSYTFNGQSYTAERYGSAKYFTAEKISEIDRMKKSLPPGKQTRCHVNPEEPSKAVLNLPSVGSAFTGISLTLIFPAFGLLFAILPWLTGRKKRREKADRTSAEKTQSGKQPLLLFGAFFTLIGLGVMIPLIIIPLQKANDAKTWNPVPATVISSKVKSHSSDDGTTYSVYIAYRYQAHGEEFIGDRYSFIGGSSSGYSAKADIVHQYPKGRAFEVFVNPENPEESVIHRELSKDILFGLIPLLFVIVGIAIMITAFRAKHAKLDREQAGQSTVTLKGPSPLGKAIGISLFAIVWNGIVFVLIKSDAPLLFPIIFGLFGIGILCASIHAILAVFNPRPVVEISPGNIHLGTRVSLRWRIEGNTARIQKLIIKARCLKVTTESSGSGKNRSTRVVKTPLHEQEIVLTENDYEIIQGAAAFEIPDNQPASRPGNTDGIQWQLHVHGDIARWPDLKQELPFIVYPQ